LQNATGGLEVKDKESGKLTRQVLDQGIDKYV
jgi:hypothetical protein